MREDGYYWVKFNYRDWECAEWYMGGWWGCDFCGFDDEQFDQIDERRIVREVE